ncbi:MAG TPA: thioesterase family protein [Gemmataceae bacterium]|nr:thioesterase family protein [Gemmataceae bacterium]
MPTPFTTTRRVEFGDTDMAGIVHFANFFRFMESAETEFLRSLGLTVNWRESAGKFGFPRVSASCDYLNPARFEDLLTITVTVEKVGRRSVTYRHDFTNQRGEPIASGHVTAVFCRTNSPDQLESLDIPPEIRAKLEGRAT